MRPYPPAVKDFIIENVHGRTARELADMVNAEFGLDVTPAKIASCKKNWGIVSGTPGGKPPGTPSDVFPQEVVDYIRENYKGTGHQEIADRLRETFGREYTSEQIKGYYANHHLNSGKSGYFQKGHVPKNKGKTWDEYMSPEAQERARATVFKDGILPHNTRPIGWERIDQDGYTYVKVKMRPSRSDCNDNFVAKHRLIWEQLHGPIPPDHVVIFKDGNKQNFNPDNLECIPRSTAAVMSKRGLFSSNPEFTETGIAIAQTVRGVIAAKKKLKKPRRRNAENGRQVE